MADQLRWWKLWSSALEDDRLQNLSMEDCWRWAVLGILLRVHGEGGRKAWRRPGHALAKAWRTTWKRIPEIARRLPNVKVEVDGDTVTLTMLKWPKYQEESSWERMRRYRRTRNDERNDTRNATRNDARNEVTVQTRRDETRTPLVPPVGGRNGHEPKCQCVGCTGVNRGEVPREWAPAQPRQSPRESAARRLSRQKTDAATNPPEVPF